jgi:cell wall-associated protease
MMQRCTGFLMIVLMSLMASTTFASPYIFLQDQQEDQQDTTEAPKDWFLRDPETDHLQGVSAEKTYATLLQGKPSRTVLVAVIDSGIDIDHEDLKDLIWTNKNEIAGNGIDDDKNGYIDDVHGWNFIGGKNGNVNEDTYELTREYMKLKAKFENADDRRIKKKEKANYERWKKIETQFEARLKQAKQGYENYKGLYENATFGNDTLKKVLGVEKLNPSLLEGINSDDPRLKIAVGSVAFLFQILGPDADIDEGLKGLEEGVHYFEVQVKYGYNTDFDSRKIVGDNYSNLYEKGYGNNDVKGPDPLHGTHVAGIIGANRKNEIGIKGIADNVIIMPVRAVPNGDERDKDVANAILYATDNGAKIINMSFGKSYSPEKEVVDKAVKYAESKGVLLVHAAGNDGDNNDTDDNFPSRYFKDGKEAKNWMEIGASAAGTDELVASFSNYGKKSVDLFAPGVEIYSTTPGNTYKNESGTSMASPTTSGVAALLMSYFPELSYADVKEILKQSTRKFDNLNVKKPGSKGKEDIKFSELSNTGGLVNAYEAVKLAISKTSIKKAEK